MLQRNNSTAPASKNQHDETRGRDSLNKPVDLADYVYIVAINAPGPELILNRSELKEYNRDPDLYVARVLGFTTAEEYREWYSCEGTALCSERTRRGTLCRNPNGIQLDPAEWRERHRAKPCALHSKTEVQS